MMNTWNLVKSRTKSQTQGKKKYDEYLGLEQKVKQIFGSIKKSMMNTWDKKKLDAGKKYKGRGEREVAWNIFSLHRQ